jgi:hypothetical protein
LLFGGNPSTVIECAEDGLLELSISEPIRAEAIVRESQRPAEYRRDETLTTATRR